MLPKTSITLYLKRYLELLVGCHDKAAAISALLITVSSKAVNIVNAAFFSGGFGVAGITSPVLLNPNAIS